jgi:hypothetical protein
MKSASTHQLLTPAPPIDVHAPSHLLVRPQLLIRRYPLSTVKDIFLSSLHYACMTPADLDLVTKDRRQKREWKDYAILQHRGARSLQHGGGRRLASQRQALQMAAPRVEQEGVGGPSLLGSEVDFRQGRHRVQNQLWSMSDKWWSPHHDVW